MSIGHDKAHRSVTGAESLGDFIASPRILALAGLAVPIGLIGALLAALLLNLIGLFTNLFFFGRVRFDLVSPADGAPAILLLVVPILGGLVVGFMARFGSERIRGHGIPEAIEAILINRSRVDPKVTVLKPASSAIAIGSGGPFGAEGPIIMTGGAVGSMISQFLHLTSAERKTLLVAGAAAGMAATFDAPVASVLLAVELLLFEWRPRSLVPVAVAAICATMLRHVILGVGPLFAVPPHTADIAAPALLACALVGLLAGGLSTLLTQAVYFAEDTFERLPIHWMWWPAIGGVAIGLGGLVNPHALGVGYDTLRDLLNGRLAGEIIVGLVIVKALIWAIALGSGTSGGVLAPLLIMGAALGGVGAMVLPDVGVGFWPLIGMGAILGGTMRVPFTAIVFTLELTHDLAALLPLLIAVTTAYTFTVLVMKRSILTEKLSRRGHHLSREYAGRCDAARRDASRPGPRLPRRAPAPGRVPHGRDRADPHAGRRPRRSDPAAERHLVARPAERPRPGPGGGARARADAAHPNLHPSAAAPAMAPGSGCSESLHRGPRFATRRMIG